MVTAVIKGKKEKSVLRANQLTKDYLNRVGKRREGAHRIEGNL